MQGVTLEQIDLFAAPPEDVVPVEAWGKGRSGGFGPHSTWEEFRAATGPQEERVVFARDGDRRAGAFVAQDSSTGLWIYGMDVMGRDFGDFGPPTYRGGGYPSRDMCIVAARAAALKLWERHVRGCA